MWDRLESPLVNILFTTKLLRLDPLSGDMDCLLTLWPLLIHCSLGNSCCTFGFLIFIIVKRNVWYHSLYILTEKSLKHLCSSELGVPVSFFLSLSLSPSLWLSLSLSYHQLLTARSRSIKGPQQMAPQNRDTGICGISVGGTRDLLRSVSTKTWVKRLESPIISLLHHLFKAQGLLVSRQWIEACFQTVVKCNPWYPDRGILIYKFGTRSKKMLNEPPGREKIFQLISGPMGSH